MSTTTNKYDDIAHPVEGLHNETHSRIALAIFLQLGGGAAAALSHWLYGTVPIHEWLIWFLTIIAISTSALYAGFAYLPNHFGVPIYLRNAFRLNNAVDAD